MSTTKTPIQRGDIVRSIINPRERYRVVKIGPKQATVVAEGVGYYRCTCPPEILRKEPA